MSPEVVKKIADHLQRKNNYSIADSVTKAAEIVKFMQSCGLDVVLPGWVPAIDELPRLASRQQRPRTWEDLASTITVDLTDRKPWLP